MPRRQPSRVGNR